MSQEAGKMYGSEHEQTPPAPARRHMAVCSLRVQVWSVQGCASFGRQPQHSGSELGVGVSGGLKDGRIIGGAGHPHGMHDSHPDIGQGPNRDRMAFAFLSFALIIVARPGLRAGTLPGKLVERIAQMLETGVTTMGLAVVATLIKHRRGTCQSCQPLAPVIPFAIIADFC